METGNKWTKEEKEEFLEFMSACIFVIGILFYVFAT